MLAAQFRPRKKKLTPPLLLAEILAAPVPPSPFLLGIPPPPPYIFSKNNPPHPRHLLGRFLLFPAPEPKKKMKNIRNVCQVKELPPSRCPPCAWVNPGRFGNFFVLCFLALGRTPSPDALFTSVLSLLVSRSTLPRNACFHGKR